ILEVRFDLAKNIINDTLHFALRVDQQKLPGELLRAYTQVELEALAAANPSGHPSNRQRREARDAARDKLEAEARDGRFLKRKAYPVLWDAQSNELLAGTAAITAIDRLHALYQQTFGSGFEMLTAGRQAFRLAERRRQAPSGDDARPSVFVPGVPPADLAWVADDASRDFLGNEFLLWLWFRLDADSDTVKLADGSEVTAMLSRTLVLECPRGQTGKESINSEAPARLPEARRAIQAGKLPRKAGLTLVRQDQQYDLTLQAETLAVSGGRPPPPEEADERPRLEERVTQLRHLIETVDLLYDAFCRVRLGDAWPKELARLQQWLQRDDRGRVSAAG